jgi:hypothetical protein
VTSHTVKIRNQPLSVLEALHRSLAHTSYHVGQIAFIAKRLSGPKWESLSIPLGKSAEFNKKLALEHPSKASYLRGSAWQLDTPRH